jgi:hypothetical protein
MLSVLPRLKSSATQYQEKEKLQLLGVGHNMQFHVLNAHRRYALFYSAGVVCQSF